MREETLLNGTTREAKAKQVLRIRSAPADRGGLSRRVGEHAARGTGERSALIDGIYADAFEHELARRYPILYTENQLRRMMEAAGASSVGELIERRAEARPRRLIE
jgi:hypothetical protein